MRAPGERLLKRSSESHDPEVGLCRAMELTEAGGSEQGVGGVECGDFLQRGFMGHRW